MTIERLQAHYGFTLMPFGRSLAPQMLHRHASHAEAAARIGWCISEHALGVVTGEVGAGKTVAVRAALACLDPSRTTSIYLGNPAVGARGLYVVKSHSRPRVSNDNPYSESQFKTLKYCPSFPGSFATIEDARAFCAEFFDAYNHHHRHAGLGLLTPAVVHAGQAEPSAPSARSSWTPRTPDTATGSAARRSHHACPNPPGSTDPTRQRTRLRNSRDQLPRTG